MTNIQVCSWAYMTFQPTSSAQIIPARYPKVTLPTSNCLNIAFPCMFTITSFFTWQTSYPPRGLYWVYNSSQHCPVKKMHSCSFEKFLDLLKNAFVTRSVCRHTCTHSWFPIHRVKRIIAAALCCVFLFSTCLYISLIRFLQGSPSNFSC